MSNNEPREHNSAPEDPATGAAELPEAKDGRAEESRAQESAARDPRSGWTQFGNEPPRAGRYGKAGEDTDRLVAVGPPPTDDATSRTAEHPALAGPGAVPPPGSETPAVPRQRMRFTAGQKVIAGLALAAMAVGGGVTGALIAGGNGVTQVAASSPIVNPVAAGANTIADVAKNIQPSVVSIEVGQSEGSGVILSEDGLILTNNHVVSGGGSNASITVKFTDGKSAPAEIVGTDATTDIAVIRAKNVSGLTKASLGDSGKLRVGDSVLAIGSPLGLESSVTAGIISALNRTLTVGGGGGGGERQFPPGWGRQEQAPADSGPTTIGGAIQTDAAINPGNSGGALVNAVGQVIGINTAIATNGGDGNIGVGFAVPINTAKDIADQLIKGGKVSHAYLGVSLADAANGTEGAHVAEVTQGSPADKAGLRQGDVITKIHNTNVDESDDVVGAVRGFKPGDQVTITYVRGGQTQTATVSLAEKPAE
ncbi:putative serine protease PepD [Sinosporangium album]|uniref:Putative serine protease PepD n=1 Tax=Sinosporangium album TaxID=504805 RepID=A0A1G8DZ80_9ACTN|nr:trypsin-like peptidase domain-containing protein [Sinosporangium album]SDH62895.1 putative serine protease PepD [Sinosporangium album]